MCDVTSAHASKPNINIILLPWWEEERYLLKNNRIYKDETYFIEYFFFQGGQCK